MERVFLKFILIITILFLTSTKLVYANTTPKYYEYEGDGYSVVANKNPELKVIEKEIILDLGNSKVDIIRYYLENYKNLENIKLAFPYSAPYSNDNKPIILQDGEEILFQDVGIQVYDICERKEDVKVDNQLVLELAINNLNNIDFKNEYDNNESNIRVLLFELDLKDKTETVLEIKYHQFSYESCEYTQYWLDTYEYYLSPVKSFDDFGTLRIEVIPNMSDINGKRYMVESNVDFKKVEDKYIYEGNGIPTETLLFSMYEKEAVEYLENSKEKQSAAMWIAAIIFIIVAIIATLIIGIFVFIRIVKYIKKNRINTNFDQIKKENKDENM